MNSREFQAFKKLYIARAMHKHLGNPYWTTEEETIENLGGLEAIYQAFCIFQIVSEESQERICGFSNWVLAAMMQ